MAKQEDGVVIGRGAQVNIDSGDIGGTGSGGVTIGEGANVNIGSGDITGGDNIVNGVTWRARGDKGSGFKVDPRYNDEDQRFNKEVDVCGGVVIREDGVEVENGKVDIHQVLGDFGGRIVLGVDVVVDVDTEGVTVCGVELDHDVLERLGETAFEIVRVTDIEDTREKSNTEILAETTIDQKRSGRNGGDRGERVVKVTVYRLGKEEEAVTMPVKDLPLQPKDKKRQAWKKAVVFDGSPAQMKVLYVERNQR